MLPVDLLSPGLANLQPCPEPGENGLVAHVQTLAMLAGDDLFFEGSADAPIEVIGF